MNDPESKAFYERLQGNGKARGQPSRRHAQARWPLQHPATRPSHLAAAAPIPGGPGMSPPAHSPGASLPPPAGPLLRSAASNLKRMRAPTGSNPPRIRAWRQPMATGTPSRSFLGSHLSAKHQIGAAPCLKKGWVAPAERLGRCPLQPSSAAPHRAAALPTPLFATVPSRLDSNGNSWSCTCSPSPAAT